MLGLRGVICGPVSNKLVKHYLKSILALALLWSPLSLERNDWLDCVHQTAVKCVICWLASKSFLQQLKREVEERSGN